MEHCKDKYSFECHWGLQIVICQMKMKMLSLRTQNFITFIYLE